MSTRRLVFVGVALAGACLAGSASAEDLLIQKTTRDQPPAVADLAGQPWWRQLARCSVFFISAADGWTAEQQTERAAQARGLAVSMQRSALARVRIDRGVGDDAAFEVVRPHVGNGIALGDHLWPQHVKVTSGWNIYRSQCLDLRDEHAALASSRHASARR